MSVIKEWVWRPKWTAACRECLVDGVTVADPPPRVRAILSEEGPGQGTIAWLLERMQVEETGSGIKHAADVEKTPDWSKRHWMVKTGRAAPVVSNKHMRRGTRNEWRIRVISARWCGCVVVELPMLHVRRRAAHVGSSPDGIAVSRDGTWVMHEYKCPKEINLAKMTDAYWHQCQLEMEATGARECLLIAMTFHDDESDDVSDAAVSDFLSLTVPYDEGWRGRVFPLVRAYSLSVQRDREEAGLTAEEVHARGVVDKRNFQDVYDAMIEAGMEEDDAQAAGEEAMQLEHFRWYRERTGKDPLDVAWKNTPFEK